MFTQHKLHNGIRVIFSSQQETKAVSLLVLVKVGSRYESAKLNGITHFLEHLMFKGTRRRPNTQIISQELDALGADYNAYTSKDHTGYYIKAEKNSLAQIIDILSDMLTESIFAKDEVERERGTILEEINMYEDNPMAKVGDYFEESLFGGSSGLGRHIIGTKERIKSIKQNQIIVYWRQHYTAANIIISLSGNFNQKKALSLLREKFGQIKKGRLNKVKPVWVGKSQNLAAHYKDTSQAHLVMGWPGISYSNPERYALALLSIILGGNMSSRLFIKVREREGLCYFIRSGPEAYEDTGSFAIQAGLDLKNVGKALDVISQELKDIKLNSVTTEELSRAKRFLKGKMALDLEESLDVGKFYAGQVIFQKKIQTAEQILEKIGKIALNDIKKTANKILDKKSVHVVALSPFKDINKFAKNLEF